MKILFIADTHFGGKNLSGFQQQPRYPEQIEELLSALDKVIKEEAIELVIHGGDLTDNSTPIEITRSVQMYQRYISCPVILALGNHDCMDKDCAKNWLQYGSYFFPSNALDTTIVYDNIRIDVLSIPWGEKEYYWKERLLPHITEDQLDRLSQGQQDIPRIIVMHPTIRAVNKEYVPENTTIHLPCNNFDKVGDYLIEKFNPVMILGGHSHINQLDQINDTMAITASSLVETPFECKVIEITKDKVAMQTISLQDKLAFTGNYNHKDKYVQGTKKEREFTIIQGC